jgi:hypothetical protein
MGNQESQQKQDVRNLRGQKRWALLRDEWLASEMDIYAFLREKGFDIRSGGVRRVITEWLSTCPENRKPVSKKPNVMVGFYDTVMEAIKKEQEGKLPSMADLWDVYMRWRQQQSCQDYTTADKIRQHLLALLDRGLSDDGPQYSPTELARLANVAESIQRIQRLALGLTTENVGMETPQTHVEKDVTPEESPQAQEARMPVFVVEMSRGGKFVRSRPTMQLAQAVSG